jgi:hypothetical protein
MTKYEARVSNEARMSKHTRRSIPVLTALAPLADLRANRLGIGHSGIRQTFVIRASAFGLRSSFGLRPSGFVRHSCFGLREGRASIRFASCSISTRSTKAASTALAAGIASALERGEITVREGKGDQDRVAMMPQAAIRPRQEHLKRVEAIHQQDLADR